MATEPDYSTWFTKQAAANEIGVSEKTIQNLGNQNKLASHLWRAKGGPLMRVYAPEDVARLATARADAGSPRFTNGYSAPAATGLVIPVAGQQPPLLPGNFLDTLATELAGKQAALIATRQKLCLTVPEAALFAGVSKQHIHNQCLAGTIGAFQDGRVWRIPRARLVALYGSQEP